MKKLLCTFVLLCSSLIVSCGSSSSSGLTYTPPTTEATTPAATDPAISVFVPSSGLNVRSGAGSSYDKVYLAKEGEPLQLTGNEEVTNGGTTWYEIIVPGTSKTGWVCGKYGSIDSDAKPSKITSSEESILPDDSSETPSQNSVDAYLSKLTPNYDKVRQVTYYTPSVYPKYTNKRSFVLPYIAVSDEGHHVILHIKFNYFGSSWLFWDKLTFAVDNNRYEKKFNAFSSTHDVADNGVVENYDLSNPSDSEISLLREIANSNEAIIRFEGKDHYYDLTVSNSDKAAIAEVLDAYMSVTGQMLPKQLNRHNRPGA